MSHRENAFTLIELMIANAIIAILATVAIPTYQDFIGRAQVAEAVVLLAASKVDVEEHIIERGYFPGNERYSVYRTTKTGAYTRNLHVTVADTCSTAGQIQATMRPGLASSKVAGRTFVIERDIEGKWRCARSGEQALPDKYLPSMCRIDAVPAHDFPICPRFKSMSDQAGDEVVADSSGDSAGSTASGHDGKPKGNNGHGNNYDSVDVSNPGKKKVVDASGDVDDEKG